MEHQLEQAHQRLFFLRQLKKLKIKLNLLLQFYKAITESILTSSLLARAAEPARSATTLKWLLHFDASVLIVQLRN